MSINHYRRTQGVSWPKGDGAAVRFAASAAPGPAETARGKTAGEYLWARAAECLSEEQWTALWLHYVEDMPTRRSRPCWAAPAWRSRR